eukprot:1276127-Alexandrium_andersonii.AAC.1
MCIRDRCACVCVCVCNTCRLPRSRERARGHRQPQPKPSVDQANHAEHVPSLPTARFELRLTSGDERPKRGPGVGRQQEG